MPSSNQPGAQASGFAVRIADPTQDEETLFTLFRDAREAEFASLDWAEQRLNALLRTQFEAQRTDYHRRFRGAEQRLVVLEGETVALLWVWRSEDQIRLLDIIVAPTRRNAGIGTALLLGLQVEAAEASRPLRHMVAVTNVGAIRLYERLGFAVVADAGSHLLMEWPQPTGAMGPRLSEGG